MDYNGATAARVTFSRDGRTLDCRRDVHRGQVSYNDCDVVP
jgi:hypothetical protein